MTQTTALITAEHQDMLKLLDETYSRWVNHQLTWAISSALCNLEYHVKRTDVATCTGEQWQRLQRRARSVANAMFDDGAFRGFDFDEWPFAKTFALRYTGSNLKRNFPMLWENFEQQALAGAGI